MLAKLGEHVVSFVVQRGEDFAADRLADWWKQPAVARAVARTAGKFGEYDALSSQLGTWVRRPAVAGILAKFHQTAERQAEALAPLQQEFKDCGFVPAPEGATALEVIDAFFVFLSECLIEGSDATHSTAKIARVIETEQGETRQAIAAVSDQVAGIKNLLEATPADGLADAEALLEQGKAQAALDLIEQLRRRPGSTVDEYKLLATEGNALLQVGRLDDAEKSYRKAMNLRPTRGNAVANVALAVLYHGRLDEAMQLADRALGLEAQNAQALRVKAQVLGRQGKWPKALATAEKLNEPWERDYLVGSLLLQKGDYVAAAPRLDRAYEQKTTEPWLTLRLASALLLKTRNASGPSDLGPWGKVPEELRADLIRSEALLDAAVGMFEQRPGPDGIIDALAQRALLRSFLGHPGAKGDFERVAALQHPMDEQVLGHAANFWNSHGEQRKTVAACEVYRGKSPLTPKLTRMYAYALALTGRVADGVALLRALPPDSEVTFALVDLHLQANDLGAAKAALERVPEDERADWNFKLRTADVQRKGGDDAAALRSFQEALDVAGPQDKWRVHLVLAEHYSERHEWPEAVGEYEHVVTPDSPPHFVASYLGALFNVGRIDECLAFARTVREKHGCVPAVAEVEARVFDQLGRLDESDELLKQILDAHPGSARIMLRRAFLAYRRGHVDQARSLLPEPNDVRNLSTMDAFEVALLRSWLDEPFAAIETAYIAHMAHGDEPTAHLAYLQVFFSVERQLDDKLHPTEAGSGTWVTIEFREHKVVHRLLAPGEPQGGPLRHPPGDKFARAVEGRRQGETFEVDERTHETAILLEVRHRYVGLLQEVMLNFESTFPAEQGLRAFKFRGPEDFPAIQKVLEEKRQRGEELAAQYRTLPMPLAMLAHVLHRGDLEAWYTVIGNPEFHPVLVLDGAAEAQAAAAGLATSGGEPLVLETSAIGALAELDMLRHVGRLGRKVLATHSVVDEFERARLEVMEQLRRGAQHILEEKQGRVYSFERSVESIELAAALHAKTLAWLRDPANCTITGLLEGQGQLRWSLRTMLSASSADSMALARQTGGTLVSDDLRLRGLCRTEFERPGIASTHLLLALLAAEVITAEEHDIAILRTIQWGYYFTPVNDRILDRAFQADGNVAGRRFRAAVDCLGDPSADLGPVVNCAALLLKRLKLHPVAGVTGVATVCVFASLRRRGQWSITERLLLPTLAKLMQLIPNHFEELVQELNIWKSTQRFLD